MFTLSYYGDIGLTDTAISIEEYVLASTNYNDLLDLEDRSLITSHLASLYYKKNNCEQALYWMKSALEYMERLYKDKNHPDIQSTREYVQVIKNCNCTIGNRTQ